MAELKPTPGPWYWHVDQSGRVSLRTPDRGNLIVMDLCRKGMQGAEPRFAHWTGLFQGEPRERKGGVLEVGLEHPDARLIAAAPCLLAELQTARNYMASMLEELRATTVVPGTDTIEDEGDAVLIAQEEARIARIDAVIAKATGGAA